MAALEYWREYRTYAHIAASYGIAESNMYRNIKWIEEVLMKEGTFSLPGKKELLKSDAAYEVILMDATESPVERPQKNRENTTQARKTYIENTACCGQKDTENDLSEFLQWKEA